MEEKGKSRVALRTHERGNSEALDTRARPVSREHHAEPSVRAAPGAAPSPPGAGPGAEPPAVPSSLLSTQRHQRAKPLKDRAPSTTPGVSEPCKPETILPHSLGAERRVLLPQAWIYIGSFHFEKHTDLNSFSRNSILSSLLSFPWC